MPPKLKVAVPRCSDLILNMFIAFLFSVIIAAATESEGEAWQTPAQPIKEAMGETGKMSTH